MLSNKCSICNSDCWELREYNSDGRSLDGKKALPETMESPNEGTFTYCDKCVDEANKAWWEKEQNAYIFDDFGNTPDDPEFYE
jgi:hypothetical protein